MTNAKFLSGILSLTCRCWSDKRPQSKCRCPEAGDERVGGEVVGEAGSDGGLLSLRERGDKLGSESKS